MEALTPSESLVNSEGCKARRRGDNGFSGLRALLIQKGVKQMIFDCICEPGLRALLIQKGVKLEWVSMRKTARLRALLIQKGVKRLRLL